MKRARHTHFDEMQGSIGYRSAAYLNMREQRNGNADAAGRKVDRSSSGQTIVALLIFILLAITLTFTATVVVITNIRTDTAYQGGEVALQNAQTGIENALVRLERDNTYTGETMTLASGAVTITISGTSPKTITSIGSYSKVVRTITATATVNSTVVTLTSWSETP